MSTNFYWIRQPPFENTNTPVCLKCAINDNSPEIHIGKRCGLNLYRMKFLWAQKPNTVFSVCEKFYHEKVIVDEYMREYTGAEFIRMMYEKIDEENEENIGKWFS